MRNSKQGARHWMSSGESQLLTTHAAVSPAVSFCLCGFWGGWSLTFSLLTHCGGDDQYNSHAAVDAARKRHSHIKEDSEISSEQPWHMSAAVFTTLKTHMWEDLCCLARPQIFMAWDGYLMNNGARHFSCHVNNCNKLFWSFQNLT